MILLITKDLFFVPTLRSAAQKCGLDLVTALSPDGKQVLAADADSVRVCVLDLSSVTVNQMQEVVSGLRQRFPGARQIAFGPHVQERRLSAAHEAGCDSVLTRGQLSSQIERLLVEWCK